MNDGPFKLLYDGQCPFCSREVAWLKRWDRTGRLVAEDISSQDFHAETYGLSQTEVMGVLHGILYRDTPCSHTGSISGRRTRLAR